MKYIYALFIFTVLLAACNNNKSAEINSYITEADKDSLVSDTVILEVDSASVQPPTSVDELFVDFIYTYSSNRAFQYERTRFPLTCYYDGKRGKSITKKDWKFDRIYYKTELHILIFDSEKSLEDFDITQVQSVSLDFFKFGEENVEQYVFDKDEGKWSLTKLNYYPMSKHNDSDFIQFYGKFATDSVFQRKHVDKYVDFTTYDENSDNEKIEGMIDVDQWFAFHPDLPSENVFNLSYGQKIENPNIRVVSVRGNSNSWSSMFEFRKKNGTWILTKFVN